MQRYRTLFAVIGMLLTVLSFGASARDYFVDQQNGKAADGNVGSEGAPFKTVTKACQVAKAGDTVYLKKGIYREALMPRNAGEKDKPITFRAFGKDEVWIKGSVQVKGMVKEGKFWVKRPWRKRFWWDDKVLGSVADKNATPWMSSSRQENIFINGRRMQWAPSRDELKPGRFVWTENELVICPPTDVTDPNNALVEAPVLEQVLSCWQGDPRSKADVERELKKNPEHHWGRRKDIIPRDYINIRGIKFSQTRHVLNRSGARTNGSHWVIEDCLFESANATGINMCGDDGVLRNCVVRFNGQGGISAAGKNVLIENIVSYCNNDKKYRISWGGAGNKLCVTSNVTVRNLISAFNYGTGLWYDIDCHGGVNENCVVFGNRPINGCYFWEISFDTVFRNNVGFASHEEGNSFYGAGIVSSCSNGPVFEDNVFLGTTGGLSAGGGRGEGAPREKPGVKGMFVGKNSTFRRNLVVEPTTFTISVRTSNQYDSTKPEANNKFLDNVFVVEHGSPRVKFGHDWIADPVEFNKVNPQNANGNQLFSQLSAAPTETRSRIDWAMKRVLNALGKIDSRFRSDYRAVEVKGIFPVGAVGSRITGYFIKADGEYLMALDVADNEGSFDLLSKGAKDVQLWDFPVLVGPRKKQVQVDDTRLTGTVNGPFALLTGLGPETIGLSSAVEAYIEIGGVRTNTVPDGEQMGIAIKLYNPLKGQTNYRVFGPGFAKPKQVTLASGAGKVLKASLKADREVSQLQYMVFSDRIPQIVKELPVKVITVPNVVRIKSPSISSYRSDMAAAGAPQRIGAEHVIKEVYDEHTGMKWTDEKDLSARFNTCWDEKGLFVYIDITDDKLRLNEPPFLGDCIELFLDGRTTGQGKKVYGQGVYQVFIQPASSTKWQAVKMSKAPKGMAAYGKRTDHGYVTAISIPWTLFPEFTPQAGALLGFDLALDDGDTTSTRKAQLVWKGDAGNYRDASKFGKLKLK